MSTNFYLAHSEPVVCDLGHIHDDELVLTHIGKRSLGWRFLRYAEPEWPRDEVYARWSKRVHDVVADNGYIVDEYGVEYTIEQLFAEADAQDACATIHTLFISQWHDES